MDNLTIAPVQEDEIALLEIALRQLASDLDDPYRVKIKTLADTVCGPTAPCLAMLATRDAKPLAATLAAPVLSTTLGGAGLFVSDLWVTQSVRGRGLARRMLAATLDEGSRRGIGHFLKLTVYHDNPGARAAYDRLGFSTHADETNMFLTGTALETLRGST
ncbi:GNAT family N-acetyltransferase [Sedimentitalea todarodis]|uniref:GNAT family N-acetyltransferase n=1 Tax=Sedimentitalea todarodis TaxID=1631240 RepID=A0ABU3VFI2_9RHOB|nr:GNAT family N-acetyltransferase [Sedimentitalea todarodis]MDU9004929.1 GNAT family N-acetyltransferase [Sedimentitalea todarodis]